MAKIQTNPFAHLDRESLPTFAGLKTISLDSPMTQYGIQAGTAMAESYLGSLWKNLHIYFDVTNTYVLKKLQLISAPYLTSGDWQHELSPDGLPGTPRFNKHAPDLYIPLMSLITLILLSGLNSGILGKFTPQVLGLTASTSIIFLCFDLLILYAGLYFLQNPLPAILEVVAYSGYKFVPCVAVSFFTLVIGKEVYWPVFCYFAMCFGIFLVWNM
jgi:hypothetical protein